MLVEFGGAAGADRVPQYRVKGRDRVGIRELSVVHVEVAVLFCRWAVFLLEQVAVGQGAAVEQMGEGRVVWNGPLSRSRGRVELSPVVVELAEEENESSLHETLNPCTNRV